MIYSVDKIERGIALLEDENCCSMLVDTGALPPETHEGDIIALENGAFVVDFAETDRRRSRIGGLLSRVLGKESTPADGRG